MKEQPKFKVNDKIKYKEIFYIIDTVCKNGYEVHCIDDNSDNDLVCTQYIPFTEQERMRALDCCLEPFQKVLVRNWKEDYWSISLFGYYTNEIPKNFVCTNGWAYVYCIPYNEETKHLLGTKDDYIK